MLHNKLSYHDYPESDDEPMTDKDLNRFLMEDTEFALRQWFRDREDVYVSANLFLYYVEDDADQRVAPDVFVVFGVPGHAREKYLLWEEGRPPEVVFEFVSKTSRFRDRGTKLGLYAALGIPEYYVFDGTGEFMHPSLRAFRLAPSGLYEEVEAADGILSPALGLRLVPEGESLRLVVPESGERLATPAEAAERARQEAERARQEAERARQEAERARQEAERARQEAERARALEAEVERLRALLEERGQ